MKMNEKILSEIATTIRGLSIDAIDKANSGQGLPLDVLNYGILYGHELRHDVSDPNWLNRDRFILSAAGINGYMHHCI